MGAINPDEIISILKEEIKNYDEISKDQEVGTVISVEMVSQLFMASIMPCTVRS